MAAGQRVTMSGADEYALVTGAAGGLGKVLCERLLDLGMTVHACDVDARALERFKESAATDRLHVAVCDLSSPPELERVLRAVVASTPHIDVLINNVGLSGPRSALEQIDDADWYLLVEANFMAAARCARAVLPSMKSRRAGAIVSISTTSVRTLPSQRSPYIVSKAALEALTLALAREVGEFGVRCNVVRPGFMNNDRARRALAKVASQTGQSVGDALERELGYVTMKSMIEMDEVADAVLYLCSPAARHITGQVLSVDGGHLWES